MTPATPKPRASEVCDVCGGRKSACDVLGHRQPGDKTEWQQKPRAGEHITERERIAERIVQALHADFTTFNKAKVMLLLQPLSGIWPEPWQTEINRVATERDRLREREKELADALEDLLRESGRGRVVHANATAVTQARALLKHGR